MLERYRQQIDEACAPADGAYVPPEAVGIEEAVATNNALRHRLRRGGSA
jgi:hypothetical protein